MIAIENKTLSIPHTIIFSDPGVALFVKNKNSLKKFVLSNNRPGYGKIFPEYNPEFVRKMVFNGYVWKIDIPLGKNGVSIDRKNIRELVKELSNSLLFRQFYNSVRNEIFSSDIIRNWNRNNPSKPIDLKTHIPQSVIDGFVQSNHQHISVMRYRLEQGIKEYFLLHPGLKDEEKLVISEYGKQFLDMLGPGTWFLLSLQYNSDASKKLMENIRNKLVRYLEKTEISSYLSLMLIEILSFLRPDIFRPSEENSQNHPDLCFEFSSRGWGHIDDRLKMDIQIHDSEMLQKNSIHQAIADRSNESCRELSLQEFYKQNGNDISASGLGLYYLSYLKDACKNMDINFQSNVSHLPGHETQVNMSMRYEKLKR
jgi:hypothetical protein